jgi:hypothetical protein
MMLQTINVSLRANFGCLLFLIGLFMWRASPASAQAAPQPPFPERILGVSGNLLAPKSINITADPQKLANYNSSNPVASFNADLSQQPDAISVRIGPDVARTDIKGYVYEDLLSPHYVNLFLMGGFNRLDNAAKDRTMVAAYRTKLLQGGQGDLGAYTATCFLTSQRNLPIGTRDAFRNGEPACGILGGTVSGGAAGQYLNLIEITANDNGHDDSAAGPVIDLHRSNGTENLGQFWMAFRDNSFGTVPIDASFSAAGPHITGLEMESTTYPDVSAVGEPKIITAGSGACAVGDVLRVLGGTFQIPARLRVTKVGPSGELEGVQQWMGGGYSEPPPNPVRVLPEPNQALSSCNDSEFNMGGWERGGAATFAADQRIYMDATNNDRRNHYPTTVNAGMDWFEYDGKDGFRWEVHGRKVLNVNDTKTVVVGTLTTESGLCISTRVITSGSIVAALDSDEYVEFDEAHPVTYQLPGSPVQGREITVKDGGGKAGRDKITITSSANIDGNASVIIGNDYGAITVVYNGQTWRVVSRL